MSNVVYLRDGWFSRTRGGGGGGGGEVGMGELKKLEKTSTSHLLLAHFGGLSTTDA